MLLVSMNTNFGCSLAAYMESSYTVSKILEFSVLSCRHCAWAMIQTNVKKCLGILYYFLRQGRVMWLGSVCGTSFLCFMIWIFQLLLVCAV